MTDKKISGPQLERWLNSSITKTYLKSIKELNNELCSQIAAGQCIATTTGAATTAENYHRSVGKSEAFKLCHSATQLLDTMGYLQSEEEEEKEDE